MSRTRTKPRLCGWDKMEPRRVQVIRPPKSSAAWPKRDQYGIAWSVSTSGCLEHGFGPKHPLGLLHARSSVPTAVPAILKTKPSLRQKQWVGTTSRGPTGGRVPSLGNLITVRTRRQRRSNNAHNARVPIDRSGNVGPRSAIMRSGLSKRNPQTAHPTLFTKPLAHTFASGAT